MKKIIFLVLSVFILNIFTACGSSSDSDNVETEAEIETNTINEIAVYDVNGQEIEDAEISIEPATPSTSANTAIALVGDGFSEGLYIVTITVGGYTFSVELYISADNYQDIASLVIPVSYNPLDETYSEIDAIVGSISGIIYNSSNIPLVNAQVSISAGIATNGAYVTAFTDENGYYELLINVDNSLVDDIALSTITASADGYLTSSIDFTMEDGLNSTGVNLYLTTGIQETVVNFDFESATEDWTINKLTGINNNLSWNVHTLSSVDISKAVIANNVALAPNDESLGMVASPANGDKCFWYGDTNLTDEAYGSFIGSADASELSGGSSSSDNSAELISPEIDLSALNGDVRLGFKTWWEIESVNPNSNGYDLMTISVSTDSGTTWTNIARLNPLSDPQTDLDKSSIPFSNTGFNSAPMWTEQETISLIDADGNSVSGKTIRIKFTFETVDGLYNGFRGWMIDDLYIQEGIGTFPSFDDAFYDDYYYDDYDDEQYAPSLQRR